MTVDSFRGSQATPTEHSGSVVLPGLGKVRKVRWSVYPPAIAPMIINGSRPAATTLGNGASGELCDQSSVQA
jgi:hypothetical protein